MAGRLAHQQPRYHVRQQSGVYLTQTFEPVLGLNLRYRHVNDCRTDHVVEYSSEMFFVREDLQER